MYETELLEEIIIKYESYEEIFADDVFSEIQESDHRYNSLNQEERLRLKRAFSKYQNYNEEIHPFIEQRGNTANETDILKSMQSESRFGQNALSQSCRRPHIKYVEAFVNNISVPDRLKNCTTTLWTGMMLKT